MQDARKNPDRPIVGVGAVIFKGSDILLIRRGKPPLENSWSLPGGAQKLGETVEQALIREVLEETAVIIQPDRFLDVVDFIEPRPDGQPRFHYTLLDYSANYVSGTPKAGSDSREVSFFPLEKALILPLWTETRRIIKLAAHFRGLV